MEDCGQFLPTVPSRCHTPEDEFREPEAIQRCLRADYWVDPARKLSKAY
jgi:hypothetical protein